MGYDPLVPPYFFDCRLAVGLGTAPLDGEVRTAGSAQQTWRISGGRALPGNTLPRMDTDQITIRLHRDAAAALVHVLDHYIQRDSGTGYGGILRSLQTTIIQDGFGGVRPGPPAGLPANEKEE